MAGLGNAIPVSVSLSLPLDTLRYTGAVVTAVFDNLLPDDDHIRRRIAGRVGAEGADAYSLLRRPQEDMCQALGHPPTRAPASTRIMAVRADLLS